MRMIKEISLYISLLMLFSSLTACDQDPFQQSYRNIKGIYYLHRWEDDETFYLQTKDTIGKSGAGVVDGIVLEIGWKDDYIVVNKRSSFRGDTDGYVIIHVRRRFLENTISKKDLLLRKELLDIKLLDAKEAWRLLG